MDICFEFKSLEDEYFNLKIGLLSWSFNLDFRSLEYKILSSKGLLNLQHNWFIFPRFSLEIGSNDILRLIGSNVGRFITI